MLTGTSVCTLRREHMTVLIQDDSSDIAVPMELYGRHINMNRENGTCSVGNSLYFKCLHISSLP